MALDTEITRVMGGAKNTLKALIQKMGVAVNDEKIDQYASLVEDIEMVEGQTVINSLGILKGTGAGVVSAAVADTDYVTPSGMNTAIAAIPSGMKIETVYNHAENTTMTSGVYNLDTAPSKTPLYYIVTCKFNGATTDYKTTDTVTVDAEHTMWAFMSNSNQSGAREIKVTNSDFTLYDGMTVSLNADGWTTAVANAIMVPIKIDAVIM